MKTWMDLNTVHWPPQVAALQKDARGYPIPATVQWFDGVPDFRVIDPHKWLLHARSGVCGICGTQIGPGGKGPYYFVGGPRSCENGAFTDLPMHQDCAEFALKVCPFLAIPKVAYRAALPEGCGHMVDPALHSPKPQLFGLLEASDYSVVLTPQATYLQALPKRLVSWWRAGSQVGE